MVCWVAFVMTPAVATARAIPLTGVRLRGAATRAGDIQGEDQNASCTRNESRCFVYHDDCYAVDGLGMQFEYVQLGLALALAANCTFIPNWRQLVSIPIR